MESNYLKETLPKRNPGILLVLSIVIWVSMACNLLTDTGRPNIEIIQNGEPSGGPTQNIIKPTVKATNTKPNESVIDTSETPSGSQLPSNETTQPAVSEIKVIGGWYGPACDEAEGTYYYRWSVDLMENAATGGFIGVAKFHDCPGGGRVSYYLTGDTQSGNVINLKGEKTDSGGGDLFGSAEQTIDFTFDLTNGNLTPNLAP